jgi:hypothetical protein
MNSHTLTVSQSDAEEEIQRIEDQSIFGNILMGYDMEEEEEDKARRLPYRERMYEEMAKIWR